jgi:DNA-binding MarR family transcriptional regulator
VEKTRYGRFTLLIDGIHKSIGKLKIDRVRRLGIKSVHVPWLYHLSLHLDGMTATEIASVSMVDRSLVSREIAELKSKGYIASKQRRYTLTEEGARVTDELVRLMCEVQAEVDDGISEEELESFYTTLEKLYSNFAKITSQDGAIKKSAEQ